MDALTAEADATERGTLMIDHDELDKCVEMGEVIDAIEDAFVAYESGDAVMPPKTYVDLPEENGDFRASPQVVRRNDGVAVSVRNRGD